jgi:hypothetical protein
MQRDSPTPVGTSGATSRCQGRRDRHPHEETFVVLEGTLTMYVGEPPERVEVPRCGVIHIDAMTPLQAANHGDGSRSCTPTAIRPRTSARSFSSRRYSHGYASTVTSRGPVRRPRRAWHSERAMRQPSEPPGVRLVALLVLGAVGLALLAVGVVTT